MKKLVVATIAVSVALVSFQYLPAAQAQTPAIRPTQGGTGTTTAPSDLQLLVGQNSGIYGVRTLTAGSGITLSTSTSALTISATGGGGGGSGTIGTSTNPNVGDLAFWTGASTLGTIATGTLSESITGFALSASRYLVGGSAALSLDSGYAIPTTTRLADHDTAFGWGNHATQGYLTVIASSTVRGMFSSSATGLTYTSSTGDFSLTSGYTIPTTTRMSNLDAFYTTPSTRISDGTGLTWSSNTLNCDTASASVQGCLTSADWNIFNNKVSSSSIDSVGELETLTGVNLIVSTEIDTIAEIETLAAGVNILTETEFDGCSEIAALWDDETGTCGGPVLSTNPLLAGFRSNASSTIGGGTAASGLTVNGAATTTDNIIISAPSNTLPNFNIYENGTIQASLGDSNLGGNVGNLYLYSAGVNTIRLNAGGGSFMSGSLGLGTSSTAYPLVVAGEIYAGGLNATSSLTMPNGASCSANADGKGCYDTSDEQFILDDRVIRTKEEIYKFSIPSTSPAFATGTTKYFPPVEDGFSVTDIYCSVEGGTSKRMDFFGGSETVLCDTDGQADDGTISVTVGASSTTLPFMASTTVGAVNWVNVTITGRWTRE